ncbi:MAG: 1,4-alpha-glucan branching protein GlgB [Nitriliruptoraceae bacterium]|nr:1,4-alpha-glucan branching protein GlgB [Nitriliruptoraceae bacterium]
MPAAASRLSDDDLHLFNEGTHHRLHRHLGVHPDGDAGAWFSVWAPNARAVHVVGDFNDWDRAASPLSRRGGSGLWEGAVARVGHGDIYRYAVTQADGEVVEHADPLARHAETPPRNASKVWWAGYDWADDDWMATRADRQGDEAPILLYEAHLGSWQRGEDGERFLTYRELAEPLIAHVQRSGFTHVELLPVMEHPFYGSWGYQTTGYFAPSSRYGTPEDLKFLIDQLHQAGIGVILDWVPSHFPDDWWGLAGFDGTHLYDHADPRRGRHPDWNSAMFDYGKPEVRAFLLSSAAFWLEEFHADGLRVDAVSSMLYLDYSRGPGQWEPNIHGGNEHLEAIDLLQRFNRMVATDFPGVRTFAEESTAWPKVTAPVEDGGLGFGFKWDLGWMHDTLSYFQRDPVERRYHQQALTFRAMYQHAERFCLPLSHDEVSHGKGSLLDKMPGDDWQQRANLRLLLGQQATVPGVPLVFMGTELAARGDWDVEGQLDWSRLDTAEGAAMLRYVAALNATVRELPALHAGDHRDDGFAWIDASDEEQSVMSYLRRAPDAPDVVVVLNLTPVPRAPYRIGAPSGGRWREALNSDLEPYGGSGMHTNMGGVDADQVEVNGWPWSLDLVLPPLGILVLVAEG